MTTTDLAKKLKEKCEVIRTQTYPKYRETEYWALIQDTIAELEAE